MGNEEILMKCLENKLKFGCTYQKEIEKLLEKYYQNAKHYPWYMDLLD